MVEDDEAERSEDREEDLLHVLGVGALGEAAVPKSDDYHGHQGAEHAVGAGLERAAGVASEYVNVNGLVFPVRELPPGSASPAPSQRSFSSEAIDPWVTAAASWVPPPKVDVAELV